MSKNTLLKILSDKNGRYLDFLRCAHADAASEKWGSGVGAPFSLEPYRMEILGIKPGKMLKIQSEPGVRKYQYFYDSKGRVIYVRAYSKLGGPPEDRTWIHADDFYEYGADLAIRYVFGNTFRNNPSSQLTRIVQVKYEDELIVKAFQLESRNLEYTETTYYYGDGDDGAYIAKIEIKWPDGPYPDRVLKVDHKGGDVSIFELRDNRKIPVYPE
jgi:hypothetical protein